MKTFAISTAALALLAGTAFAQTAPESSNPTTGTGAEQAPMTGRDASPTAPEMNTGNMGGEPAMNSQSGDAPMTATTPMTPPEGFQPVMMEELTAEMLADVAVYDGEDGSVGDISEVMPETGAPQQVIVDVGGFLGIGAKPVALNVSELTFFRATEGEEVRAYTTMTQEQLEALPEHEG